MFDWFAHHFGGKKAFLLHLGYLGLYQLGKYRPFAAIDFHQVKRLVYVCKGNICRSPFAEAVTRDAGGDCASLGISADTGVRANIAALQCAEKFGITLTEHSATNVRDFDFLDGDLLVCFEPQYCDAVNLAVPSTHTNTQITLAGLWLTPRVPYIHDPYGSSEQYFSHCFRKIEALVRKLIKQCEDSGGLSRG